MTAKDVTKGDFSVLTACSRFGFTLVELAVVLAIIALLIGMLLPSVAIRHQMRQYKEAKYELREIKDALFGFAVANGRLPWPDTDTPPDGIENPAPPVLSNCRACEGFLPWRTLGTFPTDPWGGIYRYRVSREFATPVQTGSPPGTNRFDLLDVGDIRIYTRGDNPVRGAGGERKEDIVLTDGAVAAVLSSGSNGAGGTRLDGVAAAVPLGGSDESINADGVSADPPIPHFYVRQLTRPGGRACRDTIEASPSCEFDDLVIWIPRSILVSRMLNAGRLP